MNPPSKKIVGDFLMKVVLKVFGGILDDKRQHSGKLSFGRVSFALSSLGPRMMRGDQRRQASRCSRPEVYDLDRGCDLGGCVAAPLNAE